ncbi:MAG TPA: hypothetical protein VK981_07245 [Ramlibacter sp.]|nr:hypothetical protein [Ramlibacter sp.]
MQSHPIASSIASHRDKLLWGFLALLVIAQLVVFWMLCSQQVQKAQMRDASVRDQRMALADCLHHSTLGACALRLQAAGHRDTSSLMATSAGAGNMNSTVPADFVFR